MRLERLDRRAHDFAEPGKLIDAPRLKKHGGDRIAPGHPLLVISDSAPPRESEPGECGEGKQDSESAGAHYETQGGHAMRVLDRLDHDPQGCRHDDANDVHSSRDAVPGQMASA